MLSCKCKSYGVLARLRLRPKLYQPDGRKPFLLC
jgi:hypothetical protein